MTYAPDAREWAIQTVLEGLRLGTPLAVICRSEGMPSDNTIREWADGDEVLSVAIARAREAGFDQIALDALNIADEVGQDTINTETGERPNTEWISRSKLRVETRLKLLAKWDPKRYGDAMLHKHADAEGEKVKLDDVSALTRLASLVNSIQGRSDEPADDAG